MVLQEIKLSVSVKEDEVESDLSDTSHHKDLNFKVDKMINSIEY